MITRSSDSDVTVVRDFLKILYYLEVGSFQLPYLYVDKIAISAYHRRGV